MTGNLPFSVGKMSSYPETPGVLPCAGPFYGPRDGKKRLSDADQDNPEGNGVSTG